MGVNAQNFAKGGLWRYGVLRDKAPKGPTPKHSHAFAPRTAGVWVDPSEKRLKQRGVYERVGWTVCVI